MKATVKLQRHRLCPGSAPAAARPRHPRRLFGARLLCPQLHPSTTASTQGPWARG